MAQADLEALQVELHCGSTVSYPKYKHRQLLQSITKQLLWEDWTELRDSEKKLCLHRASYSRNSSSFFLPTCTTKLCSFLLSQAGFEAEKCLRTLFQGGVFRCNLKELWRAAQALSSRWNLSWAPLELATPYYATATARYLSTPPRCGS